ncbi:MAG: hypothetical protein GY718_14565 [Lentisphaerae bacterium]|nr:hypothetical protein [Lentisphaerota bacterium]
MPRQVPVSAGYNNLPNGNFIPNIWAKKLQAKFYSSTVLGAIANHDWEGEIKGAGSKVIIRAIPTVTIGDYGIGGTINYQDLADDKIELLIDKAKYYAFKIDDIDEVQADVPVVNMTTQDAAEQMKITVDTDVLGNVYTDAGNALATTIVTSSNVLTWIINAGVALDEQNVPEDGRWMVIPPWIAGMIKQSDLKDASLAGDGTSILRNGRLGMIDRFTLFNSNNIDLTGAAADGTFHCMAGTRHFISFASQFVKTETLRLQNSFGDAVRGLKVYGYKATKPEAGVYMPATKS